MSAKIMIFDDGSRLIWQDRESVKYEEQGRAVLVWMDYEAGFFSRGRVLKECSLKTWLETNEPISAGKKAEIIAKIRQYFGNRPVRIE